MTRMTVSGARPPAASKGTAKTASKKTASKKTASKKTASQKTASKTTTTTKKTTASKGPLLFGPGVAVTLSLPVQRPDGLDLSPDGDVVVCDGISAGVVRALDGGSGAERWAQRLEGTPTGARYSPDGARIAVSSLHGHIAVLDAATGEVLGVHRVDTAPRGDLAWSPRGTRVLSVHGHTRASVAIVDRDGREMRNVEMPHRVGSAAFIDESRVLAGHFQSNVFVFDIDALQTVEDFARPTFEIGVAAGPGHLALTHDHGHLLLRTHSGGALPDNTALRASNKSVVEERLERNALRLAKERNTSTQHMLSGEEARAKAAWRKPIAPVGWQPWLPLPHGQIQKLRFVDDTRLLLCDGRDASLVTCGPVVSERLLVAVQPMPGVPPRLADVAVRGARAAVSVDSSNMRLASAIYLLAIDDGAG